MNERLAADGYLLFRGLIGASEVEGVRAAFGADGRVDYTRLTAYVQRTMLPTADREMGWAGSDFVKFRASDHSNSSDASTFHRDVISQCPTEEDCPCFTCLSYLDETVMELIPGSHRRLRVPVLELMAGYGDRVRLTIGPGDMLLFYSTLLHRGIFTVRQESRKLIQVFEVFPSRAKLREHLASVVHCPGEERFGSMMQTVSRHPAPIAIANWFGYLNAASGYGVLPAKYLPPENRCPRFLSSEGLCWREIVAPGTMQTQNRYIMNHPTIVLPVESRSAFAYYCYTRQYLFAITVLVVCCYLLVWGGLRARRICGRVGGP